MPERQDIDGEVALYERMSSRLGRGVDRLPGQAHRDHVRERLAHESGDVAAVEAAAYRPPAFLPKVVGKASAEELHALLLRMKSTNDDYVGEAVRRAIVVLNGDAEILEARERLRAWADRYVAARLARKHPRDQDDPVRTFFRLYDELVPWLEDLAFRSPIETTVHSLYLDEVCDYIPWLLFRGTWGKQVTLTRAVGGWMVDWGTIHPGLRPLCMEFIQLYSWGTDPSFLDLVESVGEDSAPPDVRMQLADLAADIAEMRPVLVRNFKAERTVVQLAPDMFVAWTWNTGNRAGTVMGARTERELLEGLQVGVTKFAVHVHPDGTVRDFNLPWRRLDEVPGGPVASLRLVEAVHRRLFAFYDRVDLAALVRDREADAEVAGEDPDDVVVAAACEVLRRRDTEPSVRLGVRTSQLISSLQRLGCEVRQGKGSEISLYRPGGRIWTLGHHKRNARIGWAYVRQVLKRLGIPTADWVETVS